VPRPSHLTAIPTVVWKDCLAPLLKVKDLLHLASTCKALRELAHEWPVDDLGHVDPDRLQHALRLFPKATRVVIARRVNEGEGGGAVPVKEAEMMRVLQERGQSLRAVETGDLDPTPVFMLSWADRLPNLQASSIQLRRLEGRVALRRGLLSNLRELSMDMGGSDDEDDLGDMIQSLESLLLCRHLRRLTLTGDMMTDGDIVPSEEWPQFIPASLRQLHLNGAESSVVMALPAALRASKPALETLEVVEVAAEYDSVTAWEDALVQVLPLCAPTLRHLKISYIADVPEMGPAVATCQGLERLTLPLDAFQDMPLSACFPRLTELRVEVDYGLPPEKTLYTECMGLWGLMAREGLPALTDLAIDFIFEGIELIDVEAVPEAWEALLKRAFASVAPTLRSLSLHVSPADDLWDREAEIVRPFVAGLLQLQNLRRLSIMGIAVNILRDVRAAGGGLPRLHELELSPRERLSLCDCRMPGGSYPAERPGPTYGCGCGWIGMTAGMVRGMASSSLQASWPVGSATFAT
jgi:hypothetical protein